MFQFLINSLCFLGGTIAVCLSISVIVSTIITVGNKIEGVKRNGK